MMHAGKLNVVPKESLTTLEREWASIGLDPIRGNGKQVGEGSGVTGEQEGVTGSEMTLELTFSPFFSLLYEFHLFLITLPSFVYLNLCLFVRGSVFVLMSDLCLLSFSCVSWSCHPIVFYRHFLPLSSGVVCCVLYLWTYGAIIKAHFLCPTYLSHVCL